MRVCQKKHTLFIIMYIDTHAHLYSEEFNSDRDEVVAKALAADVKRIVLPDIDHRTREAEFELASRYPDIMLPLLGIHPTSVNADYRIELKKLENELHKRTFYGIGECGIDLYWDKTYRKEQEFIFEYQLDIANEMKLPVIIHSREALAEIISILRRKHYNMQGIFHCFPGDAEDARRLIDLGFLLGIGGVVTFKNSGLKDVIKQVGIEQVVLETDAPYLAPVPFRGKRNESAYIPRIAGELADTFQCDIKKIADITSRNALNLFNLHI